MVNQNSNKLTTDSQSNISNEEDKGVAVPVKSLSQKIVHSDLITSKHYIEMQRRDPKSPLYSIKSFELLRL